MDLEKMDEMSDDPEPERPSQKDLEEFLQMLKPIKMFILAEH